jgi:hypothetical protein
MSIAQLAEIEKLEAWLFAIARVASNTASALSRCDALARLRVQVDAVGTCSAVPSPCNRSDPVPPEWPNRISDRPLKSAIKKLTSRTRSPPPALPPSTSTAPTGAAASTAASNDSSSTAIADAHSISPQPK